MAKKIFGTMSDVLSISLGLSALILSQTLPVGSAGHSASQATVEAAKVPLATIPAVRQVTTQQIVAASAAGLASTLVAGAASQVAARPTPDAAAATKFGSRLASDQPVPVAALAPVAGASKKPDAMVAPVRRAAPLTPPSPIVQSAVKRPPGMLALGAPLPPAPTVVDRRADAKAKALRSAGKTPSKTAIAPLPTCKKTGAANSAAAKSCAKQIAAKATPPAPVLKQKP